MYSCIIFNIFVFLSVVVIKTTFAGIYSFWISGNICPDPVINPGGPGSGRLYITQYDTNRTLYLNLHGDQFYNLAAVCVPQLAAQYSGKIKEVWLEEMNVSRTEKLLLGGNSCPYHLMFQSLYTASPANDTFKCYTSALPRGAKGDTEGRQRISAISLRSKYRQMAFFNDQIDALEKQGGMPTTQYLLLRFTIRSMNSCVEILQQYEHSMILRGDGLCLSKKNFALENHCRAYACPEKSPSSGEIPVFVEPRLLVPRTSDEREHAARHLNFLETLGVIMPSVFLFVSFRWWWRRKLAERFAQETELGADVEPELRNWIRRDSSSPIAQVQADTLDISFSEESSPPPYEEPVEPPPYDEAIKMENNVVKFQNIPVSVAPSE